MFVILLDICKTCDLRILNGRTTGDSFGKITYHSPKGISTVDYFIVNHEILNLAENLVVKEPTVFSDHSQLICWLNISPLTSPPNTAVPQMKTFDLPKQFVWNESSRENFVDTLRQDDFLSRLTSFVNADFSLDSQGIDSATEHFTTIVNDVCLRSLRLAYPKKNLKKHKKWFDKACALLRKNLTVLSNKKTWKPL